MFVVLLVAGVADGWSFLFGRRDFVAALTLRGLVLAEERVLGVFVMVERRGFPVFLIVAAFTLLAEYAFVVIIFLVAGVADG